MSNSVVMVFTRNPKLGKVKTRLATEIGDKAALQIYEHLLKHTRNIITEIEVDKLVFYSEDIIENDIWTGELFQKKIQSGEDLGEKMMNAFEYAFRKGYSQVVIVGSDLYDLRKEHIEMAFDKLKENDVVIGPAEDGGYYLLGLKKIIPELFANKTWGTDSVFEDTMNDLNSQSVFLLEPLNDIDYLSDIDENSELRNYLE